MRCPARLIAAAALVLACTPELGGPASPAAGWPDLADPPVGRLDGRSDAAVIVAIDDAALDGRPGAWEVGSGWWRYLVRTRGIRPSRVELLRNDQATGAAIRRAVEQMKHRADEGSMLWLIFIGGASSPRDAIDGTDGRLHTGDGEQLDFEPLRRELAAGLHESAIIMLDACAAEPAGGWVSGVPGRFPEPPPVPKPPLPYQLTAEAAAWRQFGGGGMDVAHVEAKVAWDEVLAAGTPRNTFVLTAGTGDACVSSLAGRRWPALAYAALGGLQGWSDLDEDGWISARELTTYAQALVTEIDRPAESLDRHARIEAGGVDLILADVAGASPRPARVAWRRRHDQGQAFEPGLARPSVDALRDAATLAEFSLEDMVPVPSGRFRRGCDREREPDCERDERPQRTVTLGAFTIDRTEVTWAAYQACVSQGACDPIRLSGCWVWQAETGFRYGAELPASMRAADHPVVCVTWEEAVDYCATQGKRLASEAEWERAARGVDARVYPWGDEPPTCKIAVMHGCSSFTEPVASVVAGASPVGALDMAGNVSEWVFDWWHRSTYRTDVWPDPTGPESGRVRVIRGGSFYESANELRAGYRYGLDPEARLSTVGFRCAR